MLLEWMLRVVLVLWAFSAGAVPMSVREVRVIVLEEVVMMVEVVAELVVEYVAVKVSVAGAARLVLVLVSAMVVMLVVGVLPLEAAVVRRFDVVGIVSLVDVV